MKLTKEEEILLKEIENGEFVSQKDEVNKYIKFAKDFRNSENVLIRINENDFNKLKIKANEKGISYQDIIQVLIHEYVNGKVEI
jgi:predicted DNA binding CopG/RHH family protein